ncbi:MAG: ribonuclease III [Alphaproteobacteria bacterium]|nr:ribonuclease III [Alphaproteobacteria bacterium]
MAARKTGNSGNGRLQSGTDASFRASTEEPRFGDGSGADVPVDFGHSFSDAGLLRRALTHASAGLEDNERLEFLGDRVLGFLIAEMLVQRFPRETEGALALKLNALVRMETCARVALACGLDRALIMSPSEARGGGRQKPAILGDACEALIAALYLDGGIDVARRFVMTHWTPLLDGVLGDLRDPKNALQEWAQSHKLGTPVYRVARREGPDHAPRFTVEVMVGSHPPASGEGTSLRSAEQDAARKLLKVVVP